MNENSNDIFTPAVKKHIGTVARGLGLRFCLDPLRRAEAENNIMKYVCNLCGWVYDEEEAGVKWEDLPDDFACELCGAGKDEFTAEE